MSSATTEAPASTNKPKGNAPDFADGDIAVWIKENAATGDHYASISYGPQGKKQYAKANCQIKGLDGPLSAQEIGLIFKGQPVEVQLQPRDEGKKPYIAILGRNTDEYTQVPWKNDPTKVDSYMNIRTAIPVYRDKKIKGEVQHDEAGNPIKELRAFSIGKDRVEYPVWHKHGTTWVGITAIDALYLDNKQPRQVQWNGKDYNFELLDIIAKPGTTEGKVFLNPKISVTVPGEQLDQSRGVAVDRDQTAVIEESTDTGEEPRRGQVPY